jgi:hypothetical protein
MNKQSKQLKLVAKNGELHAIYDDALVPLFDGASVETRRASHVEPHSGFCGDTCWSADMRPIGGPVFSGFKTRQEALDAEVRYINRHVIE